MARKKDQSVVGLSYPKKAPILGLLKDTAEQYKALNVTPTTVARIFIEERAALFQAGLGLNEPEIRDFLVKMFSQPTLVEICKVVVDLPEEEFKRLRVLVDKMITNG